MSDTDRVKKMRALFEKIKPELEELEILIKEAEREDDQAALNEELKHFTDGLPISVSVRRPLRLKKPGT